METDTMDYLEEWSMSKLNLYIIIEKAQAQELDRTELELGGLHFSPGPWTS